MFKFNLEQLVFYLVDNRIHSAPITSRMVVENSHDDWACTNEQKAAWQPFGPSAVKYATCHGTFGENQIFESREALSKNLVKD